MLTNPAVDRLLLPWRPAWALVLSACLCGSLPARGDLAPLSPNESEIQPTSPARLLKLIRHGTDKSKRSRHIHAVERDELDADRAGRDPVEVRATDLLARSIDYYRDLESSEASTESVASARDLSGTALAAAIHSSARSSTALADPTAANRAAGVGAESPAGPKPAAPKPAGGAPLLFHDPADKHETISFRLAVFLTMAAILAIYWLRNELRDEREG